MVSIIDYAIVVKLMFLVGCGSYPKFIVDNSRLPLPPANRILAIDRAIKQRARNKQQKQATVNSMRLTKRMRVVH